MSAGQSWRPSNLEFQSPVGRTEPRQPGGGYPEGRLWFHQVQNSGAQEEGSWQGWAAGVLVEWLASKCGLCSLPRHLSLVRLRDLTYPLQIEDCGHLGEAGKLVSDGPGGHRGKVGNE